MGTTKGLSSEKLLDCVERAIHVPRSLPLILAHLNKEQQEEFYVELLAEMTVAFDDLGEDAHIATRFISLLGMIAAHPGGVVRLALYKSGWLSELERAQGNNAVNLTVTADEVTQMLAVLVEEVKEKQGTPDYDEVYGRVSDVLRYLRGWSSEEIDVLLGLDARWLRALSPKYRTYARCMRAVKANGLLLTDVPAYMQDRNMVKAAVRSNPQAVWAYMGDDEALRLDMLLESLQHGVGALDVPDYKLMELGGLLIEHKALRDAVEVACVKYRGLPPLPVVERATRLGKEDVCSLVLENLDHFKENARLLRNLTMYLAYMTDEQVLMVLRDPRLKHKKLYRDDVPASKNMEIIAESFNLMPDQTAREWLQELLESKGDAYVDALITRNPNVFRYLHPSDRTSVRCTLVLAMDATMFSEIPEWHWTPVLLNFMVEQALVY